MEQHPERFLIIGFVLVSIGAVLPYLIVFGVLESTFLLNFIAFTASAAGVIVGIIGAAFYAKGKRGD